MTPADEPTFIELWQQGLSQDDMAHRLGIRRGTLGSRAKQLVDQGKIQPRPRGGAYRRQQALARQDQTPVQSSADPPPEIMHPPGHTVHRVQAQLYALHGAEHKDLSPEDLKSERWNIYMPRWLRRLIEAGAAATRLSPSQVLQDVVRQWGESH
jgi:hypothetical protein